MIKLLNSDDKVVDARSMRAVFPFSTVADTIDLIVEADGATYAHTGLDYPLLAKYPTENPLAVYKE